MGTLNTNLEKYLKLWDLFEKEVKTSEKLESNTLSGFAKYYEKHNDSSAKNDYKTVYARIKKMKERKDKIKTVRDNSILELKDYIKYLDKGFIIQELHHDETYESLFI